MKKCKCGKDAVLKDIVKYLCVRCYRILMKKKEKK